MAKPVNTPTLQDKKLPGGKTTKVPPADTGGGTTASGGGGDPYAYAKKQNAKAVRKDRASAKVSLENSGAVIANLLARDKLIPDFSFDRDRKIRLAEIINDENIDLAMKDAKSAMSNYTGMADSNNMEQGDQSFSNLLNRSRERNSALDEAAMQGAGESDTLRSLGMSARNWAANQQQVNRSHADTERGINNEIGDLNAETRRNLIQIDRDKEEANSNAWNEFNDRNATAYGNRGDLRGELSEQYATVAGIQRNPDTRNMGAKVSTSFSSTTVPGKKQKTVLKQAGKKDLPGMDARGTAAAASAAAKTKKPKVVTTNLLGKAKKSEALRDSWSEKSAKDYAKSTEYTEAGYDPKETDPKALGFDGFAKLKSTRNSANYVAVASPVDLAKPSGAGLRKW